jgi:hypothetical protein
MNNSFSKIQTGCFARITSIRNKGALVHVGRFLGVVKDWMYDDQYIAKQHQKLYIIYLLGI